MDSAGIRRILVVKLSALGDVVHALPVIGYLAKAAPDASIDWAVDRRFASLLEGNPRLRRVVSLDLRTWKGRWAAPETGREAAAAVRDLREGRYDVAFDIQGNAKSGVVTRLSGAPLRFGFDRRGVREVPNLLFTNRKVPSRPEDIHVTQKLLRVVAAPFGGTIPPSWDERGILLTPEEEREGERLLRELLPGASPRLLLHAGTTWNTKKMDPEFWAAIVRRLRERWAGLGVVLSWGTAEERAEAETIRRLCGEPARILPQRTLRELAAVCRACGYMAGPDTGPLHIAAAAGAKTVSIFRATDGRRNAPPGPVHRFLQAPLPCTACLRKRCDRDAECRRSIPPEAAAEIATLVGDGGDR
ncbi:MAG: lipopolysaccharide heptosyltransferase I [Deltaproteobacteria bacterium]